MTEWLLLFVLVPAIVVPVVLLFGFAGCGFSVPLWTELLIDGTPKSVSIITLSWMGGKLGEQAAPKIEFERTKKGQQPDPPFKLMSSPPSHDDDGLEPATTYQYRARAVSSAGDISGWSATIERTTLAPPTAVVTFDAKGAGNTGSGLNSATTTWSHTASGNSRAVVVGLRWQHFGGLAPPMRTVTYGGILMTSLGVIGNEPLTNINAMYQEFFGLLNPPTGAQTVSITVSRPGALSISIEGCSVSYVGVSAFGFVSSVADAEPGTALSQTVSSAVNERVVQMFSTASGPITSYNQPSILRFDGGAGGPVIGDAPGAASVSFTASRATGVAYAGLAVRLTPV